MVEIPGASSLGAGPSARSGRGIARMETGQVAAGAAAFAAGVQEAGQASMRLAGQVAAKAQQLEDYQVQARYLDWQQLTATAYDEEMRKLEANELEGYANGFMNESGSFFESGREFMASIPERLRGEYNTRLYGFRNQLFDGANSYALGQLNAIAVTTLNDGVSAVMGQIPAAAAAPDPAGAANALVDQARSVIVGAPHLTQAQQAQALSTATRNINASLVSELIRTGQFDLADQLLGADPVAMADRVLTASGGAASIPDGQWLTVAGDVVRAGMSVNEIEVFDADPTTARSAVLAARNDPEIVAEVAARIQDSNGRALGAAGIEATPANLMLAQALGVQAAVVIARRAETSPDARVADVIPADLLAGAAAAIAGMTVGEAATWANRTVTATAAYGHRMAPGLTLDDRAALIADSTRGRNTAATQAAAAQEAQRATLLNDLLVGLHDGTAGMTQINAARQAGWLTDFDDIKKAEQAYEDRNGELVDAAEGLRLLGTPDYQFSPFNSDDRTRIDAAYQAMGGPAALLNTNAPPEEQAQAVSVLRAVVERAGIIPQSALELLQGGMYASNRTARDAAFSTLDIIANDNPDVIRRALSADQYGRLQDWQALGPFLSPEEMDARFAPTLNPQEQQRRDALREAGRALAVEVPVDDIVNHFIRGFSGAGPGTYPLDPTDVIELQDDYARLFAERYAVSANADLARTQAFEALGQKWGVTDIGNTRRIMAYPPEQQYPAINGSHEWITRDLETLLDAEFPMPEAAPTPGLQREPARIFGLDVMPGSGSNGLPARYRVLVMDSDGVLHSLAGDNGTGYEFDFGKYLDEARTNFGNTRADNANAARYDVLWGAPAGGALIPAPMPGYEAGRGPIDYDAFVERQNTDALRLENATTQRQRLIDQQNGLRLQ